MNFKTPATQILSQAAVDAKMLVDDCKFDEKQIPGPNNTDWDGESFGFSFSLNDFDGQYEHDCAKEFYLAAFWLEVERLENNG